MLTLQRIFAAVLRLVCIGLALMAWPFQGAFSYEGVGRGAWAVLMGGRLGLGWLSLRLAIPSGHASPLFLSAGVALVAVLLYGWPAVAAVLLASFGLNWWEGARGASALVAYAVPAAIGVGATVQAIYLSPSGETERRIARDGAPNPALRGWRWMNNDLVNLLSSMVGGLVAVGVLRLIGGL